MRIWNLTKPLIEMNINEDITDSESAEKTISQFFNHCTAPWECTHFLFGLPRCCPRYQRQPFMLLWQGKEGG